MKRDCISEKAMQDNIGYYKTYVVWEFFYVFEEQLHVFET